eukprot:TRINITY_DN55110_c0_g1_i1.p1 TRINITY_DN55110_c0_g1~~TRINITY_DN55110_c0_g1_i1.p1  ORF type:complete len:702 (-),score=117.62 TRINITY_DN55110_c0_g1_i1:206-2275(-)
MAPAVGNALPDVSTAGVKASGDGNQSGGGIVGSEAKLPLSPTRGVASCGSAAVVANGSANGCYCVGNDGDGCRKGTQLSRIEISKKSSIRLKAAAAAEAAAVQERRDAAAVINGEDGEELKSALHAYASRIAARRRRRRAETDESIDNKDCLSRRQQRRPSSRRAAEARAKRHASAADMLIVEDVAPFFGEVPDVRELAALMESLLASMAPADGGRHLGPTVRRLAEVLQIAATCAGWVVQDMFARLLIPALAVLRTHKTQAFGVLIATIKTLWSARDWPDPDARRAEQIRALVSDNFLHGEDIMTGLWMITKLGLPCFQNFDDLYMFISDHIEGIRLVCSGASREVQYDVVRRLVARALSTQRAERRKWFGAAGDIISRCRLDREDFPEVARHKIMSWMCYIVHRVPLRIAEDYASNDPELLGLCVNQLYKAGSMASASELFHRHQGLFATRKFAMLHEDVRKGLESQPAPAVDPDVFGPTTPLALQLELNEQAVIWVDDAASAAAAEKAIRSAHVVGIDLEWACLGDWLEPTLALMQIGLPNCVFLVDLAHASMRDHAEVLLTAMLGSDQPLALGFAFDNDVRELARSPWARACRQIKGFCDLQMSEGKPREGLNRLVQRTLMKTLCKGEQRSYWHRRPLRRSQCHYAALDAFVLLQVASGLVNVPLTEPELLASKLRARECAARAA